MLTPAGVLHAFAGPQPGEMELALQARQDMLTKAGFDVDSAADGVDALERVGRRTPSLVLVDLEMPRMNGVELVRALRERPATRTVPVIMITSRSSQKHRRLALEAGVDVFLTKPYTDDALAAHIAELMQRP